MSLLVVEPEGGAPLYDSFRRRLPDLFSDSQSVRSPQEALSLCGSGHVEFLITADPTFAQSCCAAYPSLAVVLVRDQAPCAPRLLEWMRGGVADVWTSEMSDAAIEDRIHALQARYTAVNAALKARLTQLEADLKRDTQAGRHIQLGMLPPNPMLIETARFEHRILPSHILSGDFVDYFRIGEHHFAAYVADVSGHGTSSAFVTVMLKNFSRRLRREYRPTMLRQPGEILAWLNRELLEHQIDKHVSVVLMVGDFRNQTIKIANAGHYPGAFVVADGKAELLSQPGKPLGLFEEAQYESMSLSLRECERVVVFSDGVLDLMAEKSLADKEAKLLSVVSAEPTIDGVWRVLGIDQLESSADDVTCLVLSSDV